MIDMHAHVLPGVDDGAKDTKMCAQMLDRAADAGVSAIVCTPHVYRPEDLPRSRKAATEACALARERGIRLYGGCEFNYRVLAKLSLAQLAPYCLAGTRCLLLEFSNDRLPPGWEPMISDMLEAGLLPIIAHPERYAYIHRDLGVAEEMLSLGCELQVDAGGLMAGPFSAERKTARALLSQGMVSYVASDAHRPEHYDTLERARKMFQAEWPEENRFRSEIRRMARERRNEQRGTL